MDCLSILSNLGEQFPTAAVTTFSSLNSLVVQDLLTTLPQQHKDTVAYECVIGAAMIACMDTLVRNYAASDIQSVLTALQVGRGGQVVMFASTLPTLGPGALTPRDNENALYDTDKESTLYLPRNGTWREIGEQCSEQGISVSMFLGMSKPIDVASIGQSVQSNTSTTIL